MLWGDYTLDYALFHQRPALVFLSDLPGLCQVPQGGIEEPYSDPGVVCFLFQFPLGLRATAKDSPDFLFHLGDFV